MRTLLFRICALLAFLGLYACDGEALRKLKPGQSTESEVRALMGKPDMEWPNPDGSRTLEFSRQPEGMTCYMATLGPDGILARMEQVLTEENFARVKPGMDKEAIRRILGKPRAQHRYAMAPEEIWEWKIGTHITRDKYFNVHFNLDGRVRETSTTVDDKG